MQPSSMNLNAVYGLLIDTVYDSIEGKWTIARLNVQFLSDGQDIEFDGTYLDEAGEPQPLSTDFPDEVGEVMQRLYKQRQADGEPQANYLQIDMTSDGRYTTAYSWDQELEDEVAHFNKGGTVREWQAIQAAKYGSNQ